MPPGKRLSDELVSAVLAGETRAVARAASFIENLPAGATPLLQSLFPHTGRALVAGITGSPGAGKSTLTSALVSALRSEHQRVAILAVDPSSPFTGGAILGDRIRMTDHFHDPGVFIRSMATRGQLGGLAATTADLVVLLDAAGFDSILIETVGAGQDEVEIANVAHATCVVLAPGHGDDVQAIKAGLLEIADVLALNKCDLDGASRLEQDMRMALDLIPAPEGGWTPPLLRCVATRGEGVPGVLAALRSFIEAGHARRRAPARWAWRLARMYASRLLSSLDRAELDEAAQRVAGGEADPYTIMEGWIARAGRNHKET